MRRCCRRRISHLAWPLLCFTALLALSSPQYLCSSQGNARQNQHASTEPLMLFTLLTISQEARTRELKSWVQHYSRCHSIKEIVIVWNQGLAPKVESLQTKVPVRLRTESGNSLTHRFRPDLAIETRGVLSLDDDIFMPCRDVERGFIAWQQHPRRLTGYHPRLVEGQPLVYRRERYAQLTGRFNIVLTGAAFMDAAWLFPLFFSEELAVLRAFVDDSVNCEDLLMNFMLANLTRTSAEPYAQAVQVRWRIHAWRLVSKGLSSNEQKHFRTRTRCLAVFAEAFGGSPLQDHALPGC